MFRRSKLIATVAISALGLGIVGQAAGAPGRSAGEGARNAERAALEVLELPSERFERSIAVHRAEQRYREAYEAAREADLDPGRQLLTGADPAPDELSAAAADLRRRAEEAGGGETVGAGAFDSPEEYGVSSATLESIASCESGGDPAAISSDGTYRGKYQFDYSTWASVGGSGDPAAAPEAEQDMRAAMLYAQAGSSPWPICG